MAPERPRRAADVQPLTIAYSYLSMTAFMQQSLMNNMKKGKARIKPVSSLPKAKPLPLPYLELTLSTWLKDSHGLYDYEAAESKCETETINVLKSSRIYRHITTMRTQVVDNEDTKVMPVESIYICTVIIDREREDYRIQSATVSGVQPHEEIRERHPDIFHNSFIVIKDFQKQPGVEGYSLVPGNVIRLGRIEYVVLEIRNNKQTETYKQTSHLELNQGNHIAERPLEGSCKICLCEESTAEDPLINPCSCKGSCEFIHVGCLRNWINSKVKKDLNGIVVSYNFSKFECEICKSPFPKTVTLSEGTVLDMITIEKPDKPYVILESVSGKEDKKERNLHMIFANDGNPLKVGRGHQCEMRVNDISVSRTHAEVRFEKEKFYLKDLNSKFGTLVKFKEEHEIKERFRLQYGRVCLDFKLKKEQPPGPRDFEQLILEEEYDYANERD